MAIPFTNLGGQLMDLPSRQFTVFEEVLEVFEKKCCDKHDKIRQRLLKNARSAFTILKYVWTAKTNREHRKWCMLAKKSENDFIAVGALRNNALYHWFSLVLALWCLKLVHYQRYFQAVHGHRLLRMKMPPGSHEVSQVQFFMKLYTAKISYLSLAATDPRIPIPSATFMFCLLIIAGECREHRNPVMYHMISFIFELIVCTVNQSIFRLNNKI